MKNCAVFIDIFYDWMYYTSETKTPLERSKNMSNQEPIGLAYFDVLPFPLAVVVYVFILLVGLVVYVVSALTLVVVFLILPLFAIGMVIYQLTGWTPFLLYGLGFT